ncbi:DUF1499 domain-containing protein [Grimontia hollisae]|uniref:Lipoprotein n=2 Tax=Grimontia hollisae TaxID=673 RepID=D0ICF5_GRIHO|nr:DUF1499 domain-containing protein [Grimontia hollisae]AMG29948.1 DUF1499 domain-containing protein [Grimontia hollisae]EEY71573.1 hypothetical protein VHA_003434 [Grimontia hollisae CIP 101886]MDF2183512.1 DUF1499 domain-containing protein [Grimontia hollisae]STO43002.1 Uncharacterized protein conserved in bacteria [Grimontia hollisae]STO56709.1 Uncharacterized protein conserved in bacteria [Grimontia hollisae]
MKKTLSTAIVGATLLLIFGCAQGDESVTDKSRTPCGDKPNCVSTLDTRDAFRVEPFELEQGMSLAPVLEVALGMPGTRLGTQEPGYARVECVSKILRFVDDLELRIDGNQLIVRSESRVGYSDFGVNRKRVETLRNALKEKGIIK